MESKIYPLKFLPLYKNVIWGGNRLKDYGFNYAPLPNCGELWALSAVEGRESVIANGFLADNTLNEAIEIYMGELVGDKVFNRYGTEFPLLVKVIDAARDLSIQVHPDDNLAQQRGMPEEYTAALGAGHLMDLLHSEQPAPGDVFFIPAGRVHALGAGLMVAEIQQTSDCTYRIYDYDRVDSDGHKRQLHTAEAMDAIDFSGVKGHANTNYNARANESTTVADCEHFTTKLLPLDAPIRKNLEEVDTFVLYFCVEGLVAVKSMETIVPLHAGECCLVPATADSVELFPEGKARLLEVTINTDGWDDEPQGRDWLAEFTGDTRG